MKDPKQFIHVFSKVLGLENQPIIFDFTNKPLLPGNVEGRTLCGINIKTNQIQFKLQFKINPDQYILVHELGHVKFSVETDFLNFVTLEYTNRMNKEQELFIYCNSIEDAFVNYKIAQEKLAYPIISKHFNKRFVRIVSENLTNLLSSYIFFYLHYNYVINAVERKQRKKLYQYNLSLLKQNIKGIDFKLLDSRLNYFDKLKQTKKFINVLKFKKSILRTVGLFDEERITNYLKYSKRPKPELLKEIQKQTK